MCLCITLPDAEVQHNLTRRTNQAVSLHSSETTYVEAHGIGAAADDPIEAAPISWGFCQDRRHSQLFSVGCVKSNSGHLEGGSGVAIIIEAVLMLEKEVVHPKFDFIGLNLPTPMDEWRFKVPHLISQFYYQTLWLRWSCATGC